MASELTRLLAAVSAPVYLLDGARRMVYCNPACASWVELSAEEMAGQVCAYHSSPTADPVALKIAGLCPPPEVFSGERVAATVVCRRENGKLSRRRAEFIPLAESADDECDVLAVVEGTDLPAEADRSIADGNGVARRPATEASALHERLQQIHDELRRHLAMDRLLGGSAVMARVRSQVRLAAAGEATVLVVGSAGSGRQHVALAVHDDRPAEQPGTFLPLSCEVLGADLLRSTLSALLTRHRGEGKPPATLLLNDVDQLPPEVQAELVGALGSSPPPLRIISTAVAPLDDLAAAGQFRHDLACVLSTVVIRLPSLADRTEDIPLLAQMFLEELNAAPRKGTTVKQLRGFSPETLDQLAAYAWPGNIDELGAVVRQAYAKAEGQQITPGDLPQRIYLAADTARHPRRPPQPIELEQVLAKIESELIGRAMRLSKGNKTSAARLLGLTRPRLYRRMVQLGLEQEP
jgi:DNA-binding NtrC family response regulator